MPLHLLTNFKKRKYYKNEPKCNGIFSRNNLPKKKDRAYGRNLDEYKSVGTNFKKRKYYKNEPKCNGIFSRNNLPKKKDRAYGRNLDEYKSVGTHWIALYVNGENVTYLDISFGVEHVPKEIKNTIGNKNIATNIIEYMHMIK